MILYSSIMIDYINGYLKVAKELKEKGELDPNDDKLMDEIYDKIADCYVRVFGENQRVNITFIIQKIFETELLK